VTSTTKIWFGIVLFTTGTVMAADSFAFVDLAIAALPFFIGFAFARAVTEFVNWRRGHG